MNLGRDRLTRHISEGCLVSMFFFSLLLEKVPQSDFWCWNFILESYYAFLFGKKWCVTLNLKFTVKSMTFMRTLLALAGFFRFFFKKCGPFKKSLLNLLWYSFCFMFWFYGPKVCGILAPQPGIEPETSDIGRWHLSHWMVKEVPALAILWHLLCYSSLLFFFFF